MKLDLHVHFDRKKSLKDNIDYLSNIPIDGVGLCGYGDVEYIKDIKKRLSNKVVIVGQEIFLGSFHIIALGINRAIEYKFSAKDTISRIHSQGGIAIAAHPFLKVMNLNNDQYNFDAIEGFNGILGPFIIPNFLTNIISRIRDIPCISTSDAHRLKYIGSSYIDLPCDNCNDITKIFGLIKRGMFTVKNESYFHLADYIRAIFGVKCVICKKRVVFKKEYSEMSCYICNQISRSNMVCTNCHYICERCNFCGYKV